MKSLAEEPGVEFWKILNLFLPITLPGHPLVSTKKGSPIGPAVGQAICNIYIRMSCFIIKIDQCKEKD